MLSGFSQYWVTVSEQVVWLSEVDGDCSQQVGLLRSESWLIEQGLRQVGDSKWLDLSELGVRGRFRVVELSELVRSSYLVSVGWGRVTGLFRHPRGRVIDVVVEGESQPIGCTPRHPFWSEDQHDWVEASTLRVASNQPRHSKLKTSASADADSHLWRARRGC
jgi:hypothetical protein